MRALNSNGEPLHLSARSEHYIRLLRGPHHLDGRIMAQEGYLEAESGFRGYYEATGNQDDSVV